MALTYGDINSKTQRFIVRNLVDTVYKNSPLFVRARTRNAEKFEGGLTINQPIMYAEMKGGPFGRGQTFDTSYVQSDTNLQVYVKNYYVNVTLFGADKVLNRGPEAAMSLVESKMVNAAGKMAKMLATDLYLDGQNTNSSTLALDGMQAAIDDGSNFPNYGNLARADIASGANNGINAYYKDFTGVSFTLPALQTAFGATWFGSEHVDLMVTDQATWNLVWNRMQPQQRFQEESSDVATVGFQSLRFNGSSLAVDQYAPAGAIYGLNMNWFQFWISTDPLFQFGFTGFKTAQNSIDVSGQYIFGGNLLIPAPRLFFRLTGITQ